MKAARVSVRRQEMGQCLRGCDSGREIGCPGCSDGAVLEEVQGLNPGLWATSRHRGQGKTLHRGPRHRGQRTETPGTGQNTQHKPQPRTPGETPGTAPAGETLSLGTGHRERGRSTPPTTLSGQGRHWGQGTNLTGHKSDKSDNPLEAPGTGHQQQQNNNNNNNREPGSGGLSSCGGQGTTLGRAQPWAPRRQRGQGTSQTTPSRRRGQHKPDNPLEAPGTGHQPGKTWEHCREPETCGALFSGANREEIRTSGGFSVRFSSKIARETAGGFQSCARGSCTGRISVQWISSRRWSDENRIRPFRYISNCRGSQVRSETGRRSTSP